jgi:hypothetical protein
MIGSCSKKFDMAIYLDTSTPKKLLAAYKKAIDDGHVTTWSYDAQGDFTHTAEQWKRKAWLRPRIIAGESLVLRVIRPREGKVSSTVYAVYHGRFVESVLRHCDELFTQARVTAQADADDLV